MIGRREVWKFPIAPGDYSITMPMGAELLTVQTQHGDPVLWALVETAAIRVPRRFLVVDTGEPIETDVRLRWVGTFQISQGYLVFHVFDAGEV